MKSSRGATAQAMPCCKNDVSNIAASGVSRLIGLIVDSLELRQSLPFHHRVPISNQLGESSEHFGMLTGDV